ncbi:DUF4376 domain-containing protein [Brucella cytisi]|uniref:DUF4376 domain-containing protein n=1 Tax=Brucella cytisi TaxID=407152 RepID=A0A1J6HAU5_9HYPH|nr:DUF4376 domain-containing protein [Brucella cytisi]OIS90236.1 hypothetical protein BLA27_27830 [Brucella cytisi]
MNKTTFFAYARRAPFGGRLSQAQVDGTSAILAEAERRGLPDGQTAYVLATAFHETGGKMQPIEENLNYTTAWKGSGGEFVPLDASAVVAISDAVLAHVSSCFATEAQVLDCIEAGAITTVEQVDAAFAA